MAGGKRYRDYSGHTRIQYSQTASKYVALSYIVS